MKALLVVIVAQYMGSNVPEVRSPTIIYFSTMKVCEEQKALVVRAINETLVGPLSELPGDTGVKVVARCAPAARW